MSAPFIKLLRGADTEKLLAEQPNAFLVLTLIALRARREVPAFNPHGLQKGEALVGDFAAAGLERQPFRTALNNLQRWGFITTRTTNKGTIAKLSKSSLYDVNTAESNQQNNQPAQLTSNQPANQPATNHQPNQQLTTSLTSKDTTDNNSISDTYNGNSLTPNHQPNQQLTTSHANNQPAANQQLTTNKNERNKEREEGKKEGQPTSQPASDFGDEKKPTEPFKFPPDESVVFTIKGFKKYTVKQGFGHIDRSFYLPDIQRKAELTGKGRDETGWENFVSECLRRDLQNQKLVLLETAEEERQPIAPMPKDPRDLWGFNDTPEQRALRLANKL